MRDKDKICRQLIALLKERVLLLDGAMATMIQQFGLTEKDYAGNRFKGHSCELMGCHDILSLTRPDVIARIHRQYLEAGADIITSNTFSSNAVSLHDYRLDDLAYEIAYEGARLARMAVDGHLRKNPSPPRFVAGSVGPTSKTASTLSDKANLSEMGILFARLKEVYSVQIKGLLDGGCDIVLIETAFDPLNTQASIRAAQEESEKRGYRIPLMLSATLSAIGDRMLSGETLEEFYSSVEHANLLSIGLNCSYGPEPMLSAMEKLSGIAEINLSCHPNAGLPNAFGQYDETPDSFAKKIRPIMDKGYVNIIGGCCGTTPEHIKAIAALIKDFPPRQADD